MKTTELATQAAEQCKELSARLQHELAVAIPSHELETRTQARPGHTQDMGQLKTFERTLTKKLKHGLDSIARLVEKSAAEPVHRAYATAGTYVFPGSKTRRAESPEGDSEEPEEETESKAQNTNEEVSMESSQSEANRMLDCGEKG